ncbi:hypothetical protein ACWNX2_00195 [Candidatus Vidania fulgoroideorum]
MLLIIRSKLQTAFVITFKVFINRLIYSAFFTIVSYRRSFVFCQRLFVYKTIIFERKVHSPLEGYKFNYSISTFVTFLPYNVDCLSILIDKQSFGGSTFEFLRCGTWGFFPFTLFKDFCVLVPGYCHYLGLGANFILVVSDMYSYWAVFNIVKYFKFWGFNIVLEISNFETLKRLVTYKALRNVFLGFNTRDLFNFRIVKACVTVQYSRYIYESGILNLNSLFKVRNLGFRTCLIGGGFANGNFFNI